MPAYDYKCRSCGHRFEVWQKITDDPIRVCPNCSGEVQRVIHATGIVFKGSGFYSTDHRPASTPEAVASVPAAEGASAATSETKTEAKSESKTEAPAAPKSSGASETKAAAVPASAS